MTDQNHLDEAERARTSTRAPDRRNTQKIPNGTRVLIHRPGRAWHGFSGEVTDFYPENPFGVCYVVSLDNGMRAGASARELRVIAVEAGKGEK